jgi:hypothetical protein
MNRIRRASERHDMKAIWNGKMVVETAKTVVAEGK